LKPQFTETKEKQETRRARVVERPTCKVLSEAQYRRFSLADRIIRHFFTK